MSYYVDMARKLELHYHLSNEAHSMDALVRNRCEYELISIIKEIGKELGVEFQIETEPYLEGGLKERITLLIKNRYFIGVTSFCLAILINVISDHISNDGELTELQKEQAKLTIQKLKKELKEDKKPTVSAKEVTIIVNKNYKIIKHTSNFYKQLYKYPRVEELETVQLDSTNKEVSDSMKVERKDFKKFILESDALSPVLDNDAVIEIISPVLKKGKYKWKGVYKGESIDFYMKDIGFKETVIKEGLSFKNGTNIICKLEISRKLDEVGEVKISGYSVNSVYEVYEDNIGIEQVKKYKKDKEDGENQLSLF